MSNRDELIRQIEEKTQGPGGPEVFRDLLTILGGGVPLAGGVLSAISTAIGDNNQWRINRAVRDLVTAYADDLDTLSQALARLSPDPTQENLMALMAEIVGRDLAAELGHNSFSSIEVAMHPTTREELEPFAKSGLIEITPTHNQVSMGAGNRVGRAVEEHKRPFGMGNTFIIALTL